MTTPWPRAAAVLGGGTMGAALAEILAAAGVCTRIADQTDGLAHAARDRAIQIARDLDRDGLSASPAAATVAASLSATPSVEQAARGADFILEAITESLAAKQALYRRIEAVVSDDAVIATNTSAIPIGELAGAIIRPSRFLGTHWFHPPQWIPCVELIPCGATTSDVLERVESLLARLGKRPVRVGDAAGFVANRIQFAMFKEAVAVVEDGVATAEAVDEIVRSSFGFRLPFFGPFAIADMAGLDVYSGAYQSLESAFGERFAAPARLRALVAKGDLGAKSGRGFSEAATRSAELTAARDAAFAELARLVASANLPQSRASPDDAQSRPSASE